MYASTYAYGRVLFALSRAGYFPRWLSVTHASTQTPHVALIAGGLVGLGCVVLIRVSGQSGKLGAALLNMAVFGAVLSYILVMVSYIKLRLDRPELPRPYRSPLGIPGAAAGALLSVVALVACFSTPEYRPAVVGTAVFLALALLYFAVYSRHRLVAQAPEERIALGESASDAARESPVLEPSET
jgi:ethanolamine permease